jgi:hypothetical protein
MSHEPTPEARIAELEQAIAEVASRPDLTDELARAGARIAELERRAPEDHIAANTASISPSGEVEGAQLPGALLTPVSMLGGRGSAAGLRRGYKATANAANKQAYIDFVGDSHVFGQGANGLDTATQADNLEDLLKGFVGVVRRLAQSPGVGGGIAAGEGFIFAKAVSEGRTVCTGEGGVKECTAPLRRSARMLNGKATTCIFTVPAGVTAVGVVQANQPKSFNEGGTKLADVTCRYSNNGAGGGEVVAAGNLPALTNTGIPIESMIPTVVKAGDVITIEDPLTAQSYLCGITVYATRANGVIVNRIGVGGLVSGDMLGGQTNGVLNLPEEEQLIAIDTCGSPWHPVKPSTSVICFYSNDAQFQSGGGTAAQNGVTPAIFKANTKKAAERIVANGSCVLLVSMQRSAATLGKPEPQSSYTAALRQIAESMDHVTFCDLGEIFGPASATQAEELQFLGATHLIERGHAIAGGALWDLLNPSAPYGYKQPIPATE